MIEIDEYFLKSEPIYESHTKSAVPNFRQIDR
jgi:hypothetical protein